MKGWEVAILLCFDEAGGNVMLSQVYKNISKYIELKEHHLEITYDRPAYQHTIRSYISNLTQLDYLERVDRGVYRLTQKGKKSIDVYLKDKKLLEEMLKAL